jgi:hypothetical protein
MKNSEVNIVFESNETAIYKKNQKLFSIFKCSFLDIENYNNIYFNKCISQIFESLDPRLRVRFMFSEENGCEFDGNCSRISINYNPNLVKKTLFIVFEEDKPSIIQFSLSLKNNLKKRCETLEKQIPIQELNQIFKNIEKAKIEEVNNIFYQTEYYELGKMFLKDTGMNIAILKLNELSDYPIETDIFSILKQKININFCFVTTLQVRSKSATEMYLRHKKMKFKGSTELTSLIKNKENEESLVNVELNNERLVDFESYILVKSEESETDLSKKVREVKNVFKELGRFDHETYGALPSLKSLKICGNFHNPLKDLSSNIAPYLPIYTIGETTELKKIAFKNSLVLQRKDQSLSEINIFNPSYSSYSFLIIGQTGSGKSVLTGLILEALCLDPNIEILIVDVGGSHTNTVNQLGGDIKKLTLNKPSGINPFGFIKDIEINLEDKISILSGFIENLVLEENEKKLNQEEKSNIELDIRNYIESEPNEPTVFDFILKSKLIDRKKSLDRFGEKGIFKNAFMPNEESDNNTQITYYNFDQIFQANDKSFSKAGLTAVMTNFSLSLIKNPEKRKLLIVDECPFFIEESYNFFKLMASNVRKFGGAICLISQTISHLTPNGDDKLVSQFPNKFLFSADGDKEVFQRTAGVDEKEYLKIKNLYKKKRVLSEVFFKDQFEAKTYIIELTSEEYWRYTTDHQDKIRIAEVCKALPNFTKEESIKLLSFLESNHQF